MTDWFCEKQFLVQRCWPEHLQIRPKLDSWLFKITQAACMYRKPFKVKNYYWDGTPNPGTLVSDILTVMRIMPSAYQYMPSISVFVMLWHGKMTIRDQKITIKWNWCSHCSNLFNHDERCIMTTCSKSEFLLCYDRK